MRKCFAGKMASMLQLLPLVLAAQAGGSDGPYVWRNDSANLALTDAWCVVLCCCMARYRAGRCVLRAGPASIVAAAACWSCWSCLFSMKRRCCGTQEQLPRRDTVLSRRHLPLDLRPAARLPAVEPRP